MKRLRSVLAKARILRPVLRSPWVKYGAVALALALWTFGLVVQFHSLSTTLTYLAMSLVIVAIAVA